MVPCAVDHADDGIDDDDDHDDDADEDAEPRPAAEAAALTPPLPPLPPRRGAAGDELAESPPAAGAGDDKAAAAAAAAAPAGALRLQSEREAAGEVEAEAGAVGFRPLPPVAALAEDASRAATAAGAGDVAAAAGSGTTAATADGGWAAAEDTVAAAIAARTDAPAQEASGVMSRAATLPRVNEAAVTRWTPAGSGEPAVQGIKAGGPVKGTGIITNSASATRCRISAIALTGSPCSSSGSGRMPIVVSIANTRLEPLPAAAAADGGSNGAPSCGSMQLVV